MMYDWCSGLLAQGLACYRRGEYFEAHEHWEAVWLNAGHPERSLLQGVILIAAAYHHLQRENAAGAASLLRKSLSRLQVCPAEAAGLDVTALRSQIESALQEMEKGGPTPPVAPRILPII